MGWDWTVYSRARSRVFIRVFFLNSKGNNSKEMYYVRRERARVSGFASGRRLGFLLRGLPGNGFESTAYLSFLGSAHFGANPEII
jgi:hypothetical protein